jgi:hypothetical protein
MSTIHDLCHEVGVFRANVMMSRRQDQPVEVRRVSRRQALAKIDEIRAMLHEMEQELRQEGGDA